jgi:acetyl-CoA acetyltransferase
MAATPLMRDAAAVVGIGETEYERRSGRTGGDLVVEAVTRAIADAGLRSSDIDGITSEGKVAPAMIAHDELAATLGMPNYFSATSSVFGSGVAGSVLLAAQAIATGQATNVVAYFGVDWGTFGAYGATDRPGAPKFNFELPYGFYGQPMYFAHVATHYRETYGVDLEGVLGATAVQHRKHALLNGRAQMKKPLSQEEYLAAPYVIEPLRIPDCCLLTDGAAAVVMTSADRASDMPHTPVYLKGGRYEAAPTPLERWPSQEQPYGRYGAAGSAFEKALATAGVTRDDIDLCQLYDCFSPAVVEQLEDLGFCGVGEGADFIGDGSRIGIHGELPVNTHGGLLSHSYVLGISHITETISQLRHASGDAQVPNAQVGLVGLNTASEYCALIFGRERG